MFLFDQSLALNVVDENTYSIPSPVDWCFLEIPNGGFLLSAAVKAMAQSLPHGDPISASAVYVNRVQHEDINIQVTSLGGGRSICQGRAELVQNDQVCVQTMGCFTTLAQRQGAYYSAIDAPDLSPPTDSERLTFPNCSITDHIDMRVSKDTACHLKQGEPVGNEFVGWIAFTDQRPVDFLALFTFADCFPRVIETWLGDQGWVPTLDYHVNCFEAPAPGYIACKMKIVASNHGLLEEYCEMWDSEGKLVATARQVMSMRLTETADARFRDIISRNE